MKAKWSVIICLALSLVGYLVLADIFMWPPVWQHRSQYAAAMCRGLLSELAAAKKVFAVDHHKHVGDLVTLEDLKPYLFLDMDGEFPKCPAGGVLTIGPIGVAPTCSVGTNAPAIVTWGHDWDYADHRCPPTEGKCRLQTK
jgi:hypothetical protein